MYLKKLEISGFKSFANKSVLDFSRSKDGEKGVTVIVGPNGSGKSNIADSVRWVMGEQSMKNLRGKKSEDIIFAGSGKKARLGSAHATLYFDNSDKKIPLDFEEVSITRKIFRNGEGEYSINGSRVRLQDVVDLLAKASIGRESYSIINQGMADAVLNATPLERRSIIEDAAGVKQYQIKKNRALRKLDSTRDNLDKVKSIVEEIGPHLRTLKRQADKAMQSEGVIKDLKEKQTKLFTYLWNNFQKEQNILNEVKEDLGRKMMNVQREVDKLSDEMNKEAKNDSSNEKLTKLEISRNEQRGKINQLERELIVNEGRIEIEKEKIKNIQMMEEIKIQSIPVDLKFAREKVEEIRAEQERLIEKLKNIEKIEELQDIREFAQVIQQKLFDLKADIEKGKVETPRQDSGQAGLISSTSSEQENSLQERRVEIENKAITALLKKTESIREELKKMEEEMKELENQINQEISDDRMRRQKFFETEKNLRLKQDELGKMKDQFNESKVSLARVEVHEEDLRKQVLEDLKISVDELKGEIEELDRAKFEHDIIKLKVEMEKIGGIDPMVVEEYQETNKRFEFLTKESEDLEKAISTLKEVIKEMEQKVDESFHKTFDEIEKEFTKYFRIIFGGGNANLKKVEIKKRIKLKEEIADSKNSLHEEGNIESESIESEEDNQDQEQQKSETGIDIFACPPGKKISNLSMLSGGERSLTSLALLFAIISHNPPPFAILDEVEAALDEANSRRFGRIITELSNHTQFVIITHNRETMRQASLLYGITMTEDGISKLLSVNLDQVGQGGKIIEK